ncbi:hypothetical protein SEND513_49 [Mycobacterium phage Send513]|uniref:Uncharacterized protein n=1 Tax=Mycobacterium phage Send513 TaxID=1034146 RepID=G1BRM7_9CAUD|nr:hypothetical protein FDI62_gp49 [Mycobacterium phage Send513]AEK07494.1 hypothetical protein SEND513_49 [Mycobacterium phage Send513]
MATIKARNFLCRNCHVDVNVTECGCNAGSYSITSWDCAQCGIEVVSSGGRDVDCSKCGACYNGSGQRLRSDWRSNPSVYDDNVGDLEGYELQHANDW